MFKFHYRVGLPFWKFFVKHGAVAKIYVEIIYDKEAKVFVAHNSNLRGLVTEAPTLEELVKNVHEVIGILMEEALKSKMPSEPATLLDSSRIMGCA